MCETCGDSGIWAAWVYGQSGYGPAIIPCPTCKPETWPDSQARLNTLICDRPRPAFIDPDDPELRAMWAEIERVAFAPSRPDAALTLDDLVRAKQYLDG